MRRADSLFGRWGVGWRRENLDVVGRLVSCVAVCCAPSRSCDNCHSHVAVCLNACAYGGSTSWNMVGLAALMFFRGTYVSPLAIVAHWAPCLLLVGVIVAVSMSTSA